MATKEPKNPGLDDLPPREQTPDQASEVKGGNEPPDGLRIGAIQLPNEPPIG